MGGDEGAAGGRGTYLEAVRAEHADSGMWDYLRYDASGDLWINDLRVRDAIGLYGAPLEIVDTTIVERRCREWRALAESVRHELRYPGRLRYLYAAKANMASEVAHAAYRSGWDAETSSRQDLVHLSWLREHGLLPAGLRVVCNGFKPPLHRYSLPTGDGAIASAGIDLPTDTLGDRVRDVTYAEAIVALCRAGWDIVPILDEDELDAFVGPGLPEISLGLRMKLGRVRTATELDAWVSRFGMTRAALAEAARAIDGSANARLTVLHAMVGAAETIPVEPYVDGLLLGARVWADLRSRHPHLVELNMGGGVPPLSEPYDHRGFLERFLAGVAHVAADAGVPAPDLTFEFGSLVVAECGFHVFRVLQRKRNHDPADGGPAVWAIVDGGLMAAIPDMLLLDKAFPVLAVEAAKAPPIRVRLGDVTCDSDGRYPPDSFGPEAGVTLPDTDGAQHVLVQGVGAYQEILAGVRGAHHCGLLEAGELILERGADDRVHGRLMPRQTSADAAALLGYREESVSPLRAALAAGPDGGRR